MMKPIHNMMETHIGTRAIADRTPIMLAALADVAAVVQIPVLQMILLIVLIFASVRLGSRGDTAGQAQHEAQTQPEPLEVQIAQKRAVMQAARERRLRRRH